VNYLKNSIVDYMIQRLHLGFLIMALGCVILALLNEFGIGMTYIFGFLAGCINFILLYLSTGFITNKRFKNLVLLQRLFFIFRYLLIVNILIRVAEPRVIGIMLFGLGFMTSNFSVIMTSYRFKVHNGQEG
jgi:hypothetical protein